MEAKAVGRTVRWARKRAGMTQHELAEASGLPQPSIARIERGTVIPRAATLVTILEATGHRLAVEPIGPAVDREAIRSQLRMSVARRTQAFRGRPILRQLRRFNVPFVLIGELAEVAHGVPAEVRRDVEVCVAGSAQGQERLGQAMDNLSTADAKHLHPRASTAAGDDYEVLDRNAVGMTVVAGLLIRVAALEDLVRDRRARHTPEDEAAAEVLGAIIGGPG